jgi:copper homeostasis protein
MVVVEVCVEGPQGVRAARAGGARRAELCCALGAGGLTPSHGSIAEAVATGEIEVVVLVRPRGGDFVYADDELALMERDVACARELGAAGVALGCLTASGEIDAAACARLVRGAQPLSVTFHRAFDLVREPGRELERLVRLGVARVLTSGQAASALAGRARIAELVRAAHGRIQVVAAGGVEAGHAAELVRATGVAALHLSASVLRPPAGRGGAAHVRLAARGRTEGEDAHYATDEDRVRAVVEALRTA